MLEDIKNSNKKEDCDLVNTNALNLAFMGDAIWTTLVREYFCVNTNFKNNNLHKLTTKFVKATFQAKIIDFLFDFFTDKEKELIKRARNTKMHTVSKNASLGEYKKATGFEAVLGYLYFNNNFERINLLFSKVEKEFLKEIKKW